MFVYEVLELTPKKLPPFLMLEARNLSCRRGGRFVFRALGFRLAAGDFLQVTGANGSGKSSLLRLLAGLLAPAAGDILWQDSPVADDPAAHHARLHYIGHQDALKPELTANEMLDYWCALDETSPPRGVDAFGIDAFCHKPVRLLSAGQKRRLALSRLTLGDAPLWILDEPMTALDAEGQKQFADQIAVHRAKGGVVVAAVHHVMETGQVFRMPEAA